jgi:CHAT domain-containing protein/tetratricopeptide (TPR) repeat protein
MRRRTPALLVLAGWFLVLPAPPGRSQEEGERLLPEPARERTISGGESHVYRIEVGEEPVVVIVEQEGIDLVLEAHASAGTITSAAPNGRWGPEILFLPARDASGSDLEVHPRQKLGQPGRYAIRLEVVPDEQHAAPFQRMSRAGQLASGAPEEQSEALALYRKAQAAWQELGERRWEAETSSDLAQLEQKTGDLKSAVVEGRQALALWRQLSEPRRVAAVLDGLGLALRNSGEVEAARVAIQDALALWKDTGERSEEEGTRSDLCLLDLSSGSLSVALACFESLLAFHREHGNTAGEANALNSLGGVYDQMGERDAALDHYGRALVLWQTLGNRIEEARTLNNIAVVHRTSGEWQEALRVYGQVREILPSIGDRSQKAALLNNIGFVYSSLGEPQRAQALFEDALKLRREAGDRRGEIITLNNLGVVWRELGELDKALTYHLQALERAVALDDPRQQALSRLGLSQIHLERGEPAAALREIDPALAHFRQAGLRSREAQALQVQGRALALAGRPQEALPKLQEVLERNRILQDRVGEAEALQELATVERSVGLLDEARSHAEQAVARVEELRTGFVSPDLRAAFLATRQRIYELRIDLLMDRHTVEPKAGYDRAAFEVSEQARARTLLDVLHGGSGSVGSAVPSTLLERRQSLRRRLSAKAGGDAKNTGSEIESLLIELDGVEAEIRRYDPRYAAFSNPPSINPTEVAGLLDPATLLLEYALGEERSYLWAVDVRGLHSFILPSRKEIEHLVRQAYEEMSTVGSDAVHEKAVTERLGKILLGPVWNEAVRFPRLLIVADGALHILPFAALRMPGALQPLLESHEIVEIPSATSLALERRRLLGRLPAPRLAALFADPVFSGNDNRLAASKRGKSAVDPGFERLSFSRVEADAISALAPAGQIWRQLDFDASRETVLSGALRSYRVVHFATHGVADTRNPELSGLVLSLVDAAGQPRDGFLSLTDIYELDLAADLVVLSGCRTALGKEVRGEGLMGLTRGFLYAGVPRVVGSLWRVQDRTAAELISRFYKALWQEGLPPAAALREAQISLRRDRRYLGSYSWAGFVLQGDWR